MIDGLPTTDLEAGVNNEGGRGRDSSRRSHQVERMHRRFEKHERRLTGPLRRLSSSDCFSFFAASTLFLQTAEYGLEIDNDIWSNWLSRCE